MKVAIITDQHFGARNDSIAFLNFYEKFYENIFFPKLEEEGITTLLVLGDTFDRRKYINFFSLKRSKQMFFDRLAEMNIQVHMLAGNHDTYFKNTNDVNSVDLLLAEYDNINVIDTPQTIHLDYGNTAADVCMIPWICPDNYQRCLDEITNTSATLCMGHFEIAGFAMYRGMESHDGLDPTLFKKFDKTFSGHYHHRSSKDNITYLGNPYELTWQDYNDPRGFHIFDVNTQELTFVENTYTMFDRFEYDDVAFDPDGIDTSGFAEKYVKIVVVNKKDLYKFDKFMARVYDRNPYEVKIVEDFSEFNEGTVSSEIDLEDTQTVLSEYIDSIETTVDKEKVKTFMKTLYTEAINVEVV
jgi:DNA repair exonuclease SbcCD nuclease subunit